MTGRSLINVTLFIAMLGQIGCRGMGKEASVDPIDPRARHCQTPTGDPTTPAGDPSASPDQAIGQTPTYSLGGAYSLGGSQAVFVQPASWQTGSPQPPVSDATPSQMVTGAMRPVGHASRTADRAPAASEAGPASKRPPSNRDDGANTQGKSRRPRRLPTIFGAGFPFQFDRPASKREGRFEPLWISPSADATDE